MEDRVVSLTPWDWSGHSEETNLVCTGLQTPERAVCSLVTIDYAISGLMTK